MLAIKPEGGKQARAAAVAPLVEAGNVYLPMADEQPWIEDTLLEFVSFPAAAHDDRVDAASQALHWLQAKRPQSQNSFYRGRGRGQPRPHYGRILLPPGDLRDGLRRAGQSAAVALVNLGQLRSSLLATYLT
jgi:hypothetical protein